MQPSAGRSTPPPPTSHMARPSPENLFTGISIGIRHSGRCLGRMFEGSSRPNTILKNDPHELNNLADDPAFAEKLVELRTECSLWMAAVQDKGEIPELELINQFWPDNIQPITATPVVKNENGILQISCSTEGATIGFKTPEEEVAWVGWNIYKEPIKIPEGKSLKVYAHRIGFAPSDTLIIQ